MKGRRLDIGHRAEVIAADEYHGRVGTIRAVFHHRGEGTAYTLDLDGERGPLSFLATELQSLEARRRGTP